MYHVNIMRSCRYGRLASFANLWILLIVNSMGCAVLSLTFATYLLTLFVDDTYPYAGVIKKVIAICALRKDSVFV